MKIFLNNLASCLLTTFIYLVGGLDIALKSLLIVMVIDYVTGVMQAIYHKKLNSKIGLKGFLKKFGYLLIVCVSVIMDRIIGNTGTLRTLVIYFFVANDGISIIENLGKLDVPMPIKLKDALEQLKKGE